MPIDTLTPEDDDLISTFPANERANRTTIKNLIEAEHDGTSGRHEFPRVADATARDALFTAPQGGNLCYRRDTDELEIYDEGIPGWVRCILRFDPLFVNSASADAAAQDTITSPGDYSSRSLAADLLGEILRLRYQGARNNVGLGTTRNAGASVVNWIERPARPTKNRVRNGRFQKWDGTSGTLAIEGWTRVGGPSTYETVQRATASGFGRELHVVASGASQGASQAIPDLRASTRYLIRVRCRVVSGTLSLSTTGGTGAVWGNMGTNTTSATEVDILAVVLTDATPSALTLVMQSSGGAGEFYVAEVDCLPLDDSPRAADEFASFTLQDEVSSEETLPAGAWSVIAELESGRVHIPAAGFEIIVRAVVTAECDAANSRTCAIRIERSVNGGAYAQIGPLSALWSSGADRVGCAVLEYMELSPTKGNSYRYRVVAYPDGNDFNMQPAIAAGQMSSTLTVSVRHRN